MRPVFEDLLKRLQTDYIDLGMIHYVDSVEEWEQIQHSDYLEYVMELFDMLPASEDINIMFAEEIDEGLKGIDPDSALLYKVCEQNDVGITVMKGFAGGRLFDEKQSPFGVSLRRRMYILRSLQAMCFQP